MATGTGKTLIAHINYHQFFHYNLFSPDNILFITPNERLSKQHFEELEKRGIFCRLYMVRPNLLTTIPQEKAREKEDIQKSRQLTVPMTDPVNTSNYRVPSGTQREGIKSLQGKDPL
jgi:ERCC4-related helicase